MKAPGDWIMADEVKCLRCGGAKRIQTYRHNPPMKNAAYIKCPICKGTGKRKE